MANLFTGFYEATARGEDGQLEREVLTTISYWPVERILGRLEARLASVERGTLVRVDLIAWDGEEDETAPRELIDSEPLMLGLDKREINALWALLVTDGSGVDPLDRLAVIEKVQTVVERT